MDGRPIVWITVTFALGIIVSKLGIAPLWLSLLILLIFAALTFVAFFRKVNPTLFILIFCFFLGLLSFQVKNLPSSSDIANFADKGYVTVIGRVNDEPRRKEKTFSFSLRVEAVIQAKTSQPANGIVYAAVQIESVQPHYGDRIKVRGMVSRFQNYANPLMPEPRQSYSLYASYYEQLSGNGGNPLKKAAIWFSGKFNEVLLKILPQKESSLLGSILLGSSVSPLPDETKETYRRAGLIHLLVVSGTQVSILIGICLALARAAGLSVPLAVAATSFFNLLLVVVTGAGPSILRAAIMGEIMLIGLLFEREKEIYTSLALSALVLLLLNPLNLFDLGFQLSFAATWALVYLVPVLNERLFPTLKCGVFKSMLAVSLAPILATAPIIAFNFSQISPLSII